MLQDKAQKLTPGQIAALRLVRGQGIGPITFFKLINRYKTAQKAVAALEVENGRLKPAPLSAIEAETKKMAKLGARFVFFTEDAYPAALKTIADPPPVLAVLGDVCFLNKPAVAIVGTRNASANGQKMAQTLAENLAQEGFVIASGLARGIDTAAHKGALAADGGTIAVLGGGIDHIYPLENTDLFWSIAKQGVIVAETPLGVRPTAQSFPRRNRIVAGLCGGVVVVEAARHSGSLITAQLAGEQGREVMAVPGHPSDPRSAGCNHLLRQGASLVGSAEEVLEAVQGFKENFPQNAPVYYTREEQTELDFLAEEAENTVTTSIKNSISTDSTTLGARLLELIGTSQTPLDDLAMALETDEATFLATLTELELEGAVERMAGGYVVRLK